ncbi:MAG: DMT family transporter [Acidimicrobiales bacterium]
MLGIVFAALSGLSYGSADFAGAVASKETDSTLVTVLMQIFSLICLIGFLVVFPQESYPMVDLAWGALGGLGTAFGLAAFYKALSIGPMSTAAALTALTGATVPIVAGIVLGASPSPLALVGIALSIPAVVLVAVGDMGFKSARIALPPRTHYRQRMHRGTTRSLAVLAGLGFGLFFVALSRTTSTGLFPLVGARVASIAALVGFISLGRNWAPVARRWWALIALTGVLDLAANGFYLHALQRESLPNVAAVTSLYPVATVLLARGLLGERLTKPQLVGLGLSLVALVLVARGG